jgi:membrane-anchored mycosin MYCP
MYRQHGITGSAPSTNVAPGVFRDHRFRHEGLTMTRQAWRIFRLLVLLICFWLAAPVVAAAAPDQHVKYYLVPAPGENGPETLAVIAERLLGDADRAGEIFVLNRDRVQFDGERLVDPAELRPGWSLVLPWDAVGAGVRYGLLPTGPVATPDPVTRPNPSASPGKPTGSECLRAAASATGQMPWAQLRLAPEQAWTRSRGEGVTVAVLDTGVDGSAAQLRDNVLAGADVVSGDGRGDTDCQGRGTALAGIIAARPGSGSKLVGVAPASTILPVRIGDHRSAPNPGRIATGIDVAVSAGARVITLPIPPELSDPELNRAVADALRHDVLLVTSAAGPRADDGLEAKLLRVGGVGVDGRPADDTGSADVVAPGADLLVLGPGGTGITVADGTEYAVAYAAGLAALVRAANPELTVSQVIERIETTADLASGNGPDPRLGWGLINPAAAVAASIPPGETPYPGSGAAGTPDTGQDGAGRLVAVILVTLLGLVTLGVVGVRLRRWIRAGSVGPDPVETGGGSE